MVFPLSFDSFVNLELNIKNNSAEKSISLRVLAWLIPPKLSGLVIGL
mgnify:CR=1 FL=1